MAEIRIKHRHSLPPAKARKVVEQVAKKLAERFDIEYEWEDDVLQFSRAGVDGRIALHKDSVDIHAKLGFLLSTMKGPIEAEIRRVLDERFG